MSIDVEVDYPALVKYESKDMTSSCPVEVETLINCCRKFDVVVHAGRSAIFRNYLSEKFSTVYSFEPDLERFIKQMANGTRPNIYVMFALLGEQHGPVTYYDGLKTVTVPSFTVDDFALRHCDAIMVDDVSALRGARGTLERFEPVVMIGDRVLENARLLCR